MIPDQIPVWLILLAFVCLLGPLVFIHELGHYLVARWFGIASETFSIGFGREMFGWTDKQGMRWKIGWLPLGGYVKFLGDDDPSSSNRGTSTLSPELRDKAFQFRPIHQRFLVVLAGPIANFLLAILFFAAFFSLVGAPLSNVVGAVSPGTAAAGAGFGEFKINPNLWFSSPMISAEPFPRLLNCWAIARCFYTAACI